MTDTQWGPPLTGTQMKALRDAGLPCHTPVHGALDEWPRTAGQFLYGARGAYYHLPADHIAYTLLEKGWLDIPNVRLWFGGDKAPDDWKGGPLLTENGEIAGAFTWSASDPSGYTVIAYIAKAEDAIMDHLDSLSPPDDTVTIAKMTEAEAEELWMFSDGTKRTFVDRLRQLGLIKPEPTRAERFWQGKELHSLYGDESARALIDAALEFER